MWIDVVSGARPLNHVPAVVAFQDPPGGALALGMTGRAPRLHILDMPGSLACKVIGTHRFRCSAKRSAQLIPKEDGLGSVHMITGTADRSVEFGRTPPADFPLGKLPLRRRRSVPAPFTGPLRR